MRFSRSRCCPRCSPQTQTRSNLTCRNARAPRTHAVLKFLIGASIAAIPCLSDKSWYDLTPIEHSCQSRYILKGCLETGPYPAHAMLPSADVPTKIAPPRTRTSGRSLDRRTSGSGVPVRRDAICFIASMDGLYGFPRPRRVRVVQRVRLRFEGGLTLPPTMHAFVTGATDETREAFHSPCVLRFLPYPSCPSRCTPSSRLCVMHRRAATATTRWPSTLSLE